MRPHDAAAAKVDYRLLAARGYAVKDDVATDRILVRDFVLPIRIGAYQHEREKTQNVRFNVDVGIVRAPHVAQDMRDVFSYDVILDGIRMIVAQEHIALIETLAERIAALILAQHRVVSVTLTIEKLDVGPGAVGVEIVRKRPAELAQVRPLQSGGGRGRPEDRHLAHARRRRPHRHQDRRKLRVVARSAALDRDGRRRAAGAPSSCPAADLLRTRSAPRSRGWASTTPRRITWRCSAWSNSDARSRVSTDGWSLADSMAAPAACPRGRQGRGLAAGPHGDEGRRHSRRRGR